MARKIHRNPHGPGSEVVARGTDPNGGLGVVEFGLLNAV